MLSLLKTKLVAVIIGVLATTTAAGTVTIVAAQHHAGPFAPGAIFGSHGPSADATKTPHDGQKDQHFEAQGQIQAVTFDAGNASGTLVFLPNGASATLSVHFTAQTHVEVTGDHAKDGTSTTHGNPGAAGLKAGLYANIVGTKQTDGSILATEIQANANGQAHQGGAQPTPGPGNGHHEPTPGPGDGHHQPTPGPGN